MNCLEMDIQQLIYTLLKRDAEIQALRKDAERMRNALNKIAAMDSMSYHSLESAKIVATGAMGKSI